MTRSLNSSKITIWNLDLRPRQIPQDHSLQCNMQQIQIRTPCSDPTVTYDNLSFLRLRVSPSSANAIQCRCSQNLFHHQIRGGGAALLYPESSISIIKPTNILSCHHSAGLLGMGTDHPPESHDIFINTLSITPLRRPLLSAQRYSTNLPSFQLHSKQPHFFLNLQYTLSNGAFHCFFEYWYSFHKAI
jgi:hypothetical protein